MILAAALLIAQAQAQLPEVGGQKNTFLGIYKELVTLTSTSGPSEIPTPSLRYTSLGFAEWSAIDGGMAGVPCKIFRSDGVWHYETLDKKKGFDYRVASYDFISYVGLDGMPLKSSSRFHDEGQLGKDLDIAVDTTYTADEIASTVVKDGRTTRKIIRPLFPMSRFAGMFRPLLKEGLILEEARDGAFIHPYTGLPEEFNLRVAGRFRGSFFFEPQEGYRVNISSKWGVQNAFVSRQGQLLRVDLGHRMDATQQIGTNGVEHANWGKFDAANWKVSTVEANPNRPRYRTLGVPILLEKPRTLFIVPCVVAI